MKKWYKSAFCKGMLILAAHVSAVALAVCLMIGLAYPGQNYEDLFRKKKEVDYEETAGFAKKIQKDIEEVIDIIVAENMLSTDGNIDLDKVIDMKAFQKEGKIAENPGEFSFKLDDLLKGGRHNQIIVCRRPDGDLKYQYYTSKQFIDVIKANDWQFSDDVKEEYSQDELYRSIEEEYWMPDSALYDKDKKVIFESMWCFGESIDATVKTAGGQTMLELANTSSEWNGKLEEMFDVYQQERNNISDMYENYLYAKDYLEEGNTNLSYLFVNTQTNMVKTNRAEYNSPENVENSIKKVSERGKYVLIAPTLVECATNIKPENMDLELQRHLTQNILEVKDNFKFIVSVDTDYPVRDGYYTQNQAYKKYMPWMERAVGVAIASTVVFIISIIWLTAVAGRSNQEEGVVLLFYDKWKTEISLTLIGGLLAGAVTIAAVWLDELVSWDWLTQSVRVETTALGIVGTVVVALGVCALFLIGYLSLVRILKARTLWKNSILKWVVNTLKYIFDNRSCVTKGIIVGGALFLINLLMVSNVGFFIMLAVVVDAFAVIVMVKRQIEKEKIKKGIMRIADGDSEYKIPVGSLSKDNKDIAEKVNHIGEGIQNAVEKSLKDERLKTDLITNVSHDIKTPLTSIINYVGLLKQEQFADPKIQRYLDILDQKSQRLKTLTEDVVEASKISSGNINLEFINLNLVEMIHQTTGEFSEKFEKKDLQMVLSVPEEPAVIRVDGRRMWRVIENIYNNAAKYAMPGTRIYADMTANGKVVQFSLKNVSEHPLNITADELTERFIRGDISRSTEGSGLGLSIAKNLTEMQGGEFKLYVDGDLFKVTITFPQMKSASMNAE